MSRRRTKKLNAPLIVSFIVLISCNVLSLILVASSLFTLYALTQSLHPFMFLPVVLAVTTIIVAVFIGLANDRGGLSGSQVGVAVFIMGMIALVGLLIGPVYDWIIWTGNSRLYGNFSRWFFETRPVFLEFFGLVLLVICVVVGLVIVFHNNARVKRGRQLQRRRTRRRSPRAMPVKRQEVPKLEVEGRHALPGQFRCIECGSVITGGRGACPDCGAAQKRCMVCHHFIGQEELYNSCPHCEQLAHRTHLLEWIKIKGVCPYCKRKLRARDVS